MGRLTETQQKSSAGRLFGVSKITVDGVDYMTRIWVGRLRLHIFHRGEVGEDHHDHPWDFWTFPFTSYVEEVLEPIRETLAYTPDGTPITDIKPRYYKRTQVVKAWRLHKRPAEHSHRVLGRAKRLGSGGGFIHQFVHIGWRLVPGKIVTVVWQGGIRRKWGFTKNRDGKWCWVGWKQYTLEGGREAPCSED
tara:strand:+ start:5046 stop:5621 length:576 start_codon:yes stop_codon:yes gene_type:complete